MTDGALVFNPPPGWPRPPAGWVPPKGWTPDPSWPSPPKGWRLWLPAYSHSEDGDPSEQAHPSSSPGCPLPESSSDSNLGVEAEQRIAILEAENAGLRARLGTTSPSDDVVVLDDEHVLQDVGIYRYHHPLESAAAYQGRLDDVNARIADLVRSNKAIEVSSLFTFDNSLAKGRQMTAALSKLMLRAYNAEADNSLRSLRAGNVVTAKKRIEASRSAIARLGGMMEMRISDAFHALRVEEIELTADYLMKKQEELEAERERREQLREERKAAEELAAQRELLDKERGHLMRAIDALAAIGSEDPELTARLGSVDAAIAQNDFRAANIRAGYVYVISNRGSFGEGVVKIGLTRRLEPMDRVLELGDASVPFRFDVHGLFFSEDAVALEAELHHHFASRRLNHANTRREFFFASPAEIRDVLSSKMGNLLEFRDHAESTEYLQSLRHWPDDYRSR